MYKVEFILERKCFLSLLNATAEARRVEKSSTSRAFHAHDTWFYWSSENAVHERLPLSSGVWVWMEMLQLIAQRWKNASVWVWIHLYAGFRLVCRYAAWSSLAVSELQLSAATPLWLYHRAASLSSWIEFHCLRPAALDKAARLLARGYLPLGHPPAASGACAVVQISSSKRQCSKWQASLKAA